LEFLSIKDKRKEIKGIDDPNKKLNLKVQKISNKY